MRRAALILAVALAAAALVTLTSGFSSSTRSAYLVRAIFDDASFAVPGEDVRVAGANVGSIQSLGVTADKRAAVTIAVTNHGFAPFHADATCTIRPQSLIGEEYVDCNPGRASTPALALIDRGAGRGAHYLPVIRTSSPIDSDIVQDISTEPVRQSLGVIIDEIGTGLAARGSDLGAVIRRANPALGETDQVLRILAAQNHQLAGLARDSDTVLGPLARARAQLGGFIVSANTTSVASAQRAADISRTFKLFPTFLRQLHPLMTDLGSLANQGTPLMDSLGQSAAAVGRQFANLTPFAARARTALIDLGVSAQRSQPALVGTQPLAVRLRRLGAAGAPTARLLDQLTSSLNRTGAIEQLMALLYGGAVAGNGFDSLGHYLRAEPLISSCTKYATSALPGCSANFPGAAAAASTSAETRASAAIVTQALHAASSRALGPAAQRSHRPPAAGAALR